MVAPTLITADDTGNMIMRNNEGNDITVKVTGWLVIPERVALIFVVPAAEPVAVPFERIEAISLFELVQFT